MNLTKTTSLLALSVLLGVPIFGAASCVAEDLNQYDPPTGLGGYNPGEGPPPGGTTGTGYGTSGQGGMGGGPPMPPMCDDSLKRCEYEFSLPDSGQTTVEVRGNFSPTGWDMGMAMTKAGGKWSVIVPIPYNQNVQYKFVVDGTWITDPTNPNQIDDGFGGFNSLVTATTCDPWTCDEPPPLPEDSPIEQWRDAVMYFVFVDRFVDGNPANNGTPIGGVPAAANYHGGDWQGVINKINEGYFSQLGVNTLWLTVPVDNTELSGVGTDQKNYSGYHGYWPKDLSKTEEHFGDMAKLKELVDKAHTAGIKVLIDYAANHVHSSAAVYQQNMGWFWPNSNGNGGNCVCGEGCGWEGATQEKCWFTSYLPDFNFEIADARKYSIDNMIWWWQQTGVDGFRLDALKHMHISWLTDLRARVKTDIETTTGKHFYMVGETYTGNQGLIKYYVDPLTKLDGQFDFPHRAQVCSKILMRQGSMQELESFLNGNDAYYGNGIMSTFIGNHDLPRVIHLSQDTPLWSDSWDGGKDRNWDNQPGLPSEQSAFQRMAVAFTLLMTTRGVPLIYYGDEIGLPGAGDPDNRRDMQWTGYSAGQSSLKAHLQKLGQIRKDHVALRRGTRSSLWATQNSMAYKMVHPMETVYVAINRGDGQDSVSGLPSGSLTNLLTGQTVTGPTLNLPARSSVVLVQP